MTGRRRAWAAAAARGAVVLVAALALVGAVAAPATAAVDDAGERARVALADQMDSRGAPGAAVVVVDVDGATQPTGSARPGTA